MADEIVIEEGQPSTELVDLLPEPRRGIGWGLECMQVLSHGSSGRLFIKHLYPESEYEIQDKNIREDVFFLVGSLSEEVKRYWKKLDSDIKESISSAEDRDEEMSLLRRENENLKGFIAQRSGAEEGTKEELQGKLEAEKAARAADKAGFESVIRELREEVEALKGGVK